MALEFDPIDRAAELWAERVGPADAMHVVTSVMRVHQILLAELDGALRPFGITFSRYEVLRLLSFSRRVALPLSTIGERLLVHPTSVTNAIDRLVAQGLVDRMPDEADRRRVLASLTDAGRVVLDDATGALTAIDFGVGALTPAQRAELSALLRPLRAGDVG